MLIFCTSSGGAGNLAHRFPRDLAGIPFKPRLHRQLFSASRTTKYFFLFAPSTKVTPPMVL